MRVLAVGSTFMATPLEEPLRRGLGGADLGVRFALFAQVTGLMLDPATVVGGDAVAAKVVLVRAEDWLRESRAALDAAAAEGPTAAERARPLLSTALDELLAHLPAGVAQGPTWLVACPSRGWLAKRYDLAATCATMTNLLVARARRVPGLRVLSWPGFADASVESTSSDRLGHMPFTPEGFDALGAWVASQVAPAVGDPAIARGQDVSASKALLARYVSDLALTLDVRSARGEDVAKIRQLFATVAAFSLNGSTPTAEELEEVVARPAPAGANGGRRCWVLQVSDRLGRYGIAGVVLARVQEADFDVEALLVSCPVLGKQVEHGAVSAIGALAQRNRCRRVVFRHGLTGRNPLVRPFLESVGARAADGEEDLACAADALADGARSAAIAPDAVRFALVDD